MNIYAGAPTAAFELASTWTSRCCHPQCRAQASPGESLATPSRRPQSSTLSSARRIGRANVGNRRQRPSARRIEVRSRHRPQASDAKSSCVGNQTGTIASNRQAPPPTPRGGGDRPHLKSPTADGSIGPRPRHRSGKQAACTRAGTMI